ncbi:hypothetical protein M3Y94_00354100 [Aphelenchoides besseyi]|nr:hypothetical protein M3Y94_00354100 [Aphelenchoides besseyi]
MTSYVLDSFTNQCNNPLIGGIVFDQKFVDSDSSTQELAYKIRLSNTKRRFAGFGQGFQPWDTKLTFTNWAFSGPVDKDSDLGGTPGYWDEGFLSLQRAVDISVGYYLNGMNSSPPIVDDNMLQGYMHVMGLSQFVQWIANFIVNFAKILVVVIASTVLMHFVTKQTDITITFVFFLLYAFNATVFGFALSTFLQSGTVATLMAVVTWIMLYFWSSFFLGIDIQAPYSFSVRMVNCLNPNVALGLGLNLIAQYETQSTGLHWSRIAIPSSPDDEITMLHIMVMLVVDASIFILITWYVEAINPNGDGVSQPPWFPFLGSKYHKLAVNELNIKMYEGQITALLGHNGAGKSTTMSMLIGNTGPTSGTAYIDGHDIRTSLPLIRKQLGFCPQYNILVNRMTVFEHLLFFCKLKGRKWDPDEAMYLLEQLQLAFKKDTYAGNLSGGQQRKLSLAIALIGSSEIVIIDEPTSGMDVGARHNTWTLLQKEKKTRTILLSTHFMEEADLLGDKIAILSHGELQCSGSSMFLKKKYGAGYHLIIVYQSNDAEMLETMNKRTHELLKSYCPSVVCQSIVGSEANFLLSEEDRSKFSRLFARLESIQEQLGIRSFGVSITTMEEVFLRVNDAVDELFGKRRQINFNVLYMMLFVWSAKQFPSAKTQDSLVIDMSPYDSQNVPANIYFSTSPVFSNWIVDLNDTIHKWSPNLKVQLSPVEEQGALTQSIVRDIKNKGTRTFGLHNPVAFESSEFEGFPIPMITALFNNFALHSPALGVAIADSILLRQMLNRTFYITVQNHPMPPTIADSLKNDQVSQTGGMFIGYAIITAMSMVVSGYASLLIRERKKHFKHMQIMSGLKSYLYWLTTFIWDFAFFLLPALLIISTFYLFNVNVYVDRTQTTLILALVLIMFAHANIPFTYAFQFMFTSAPKEMSYSMNVLNLTNENSIAFGIAAFAIQGLVFWILTIVIENGYWSKLMGCFKRRSKQSYSKENEAFAWSDESPSSSFVDSDVLEEQERVTRMPSGQHPVVVKELRKTFHTTTHDCFGLLGVNGAGKTSTFRSLVGEIPISSGDAFISGHSVRNNWRQELTGEETLYLIARLRAIPERMIASVVDAIVETIDIKPHAKRPIKTYSGGNKRRLSLGIALVGMPITLMLDEPTTGVDPKARRAIWNILAQLRSLGKAIVLTSHSMDECEAVCTNVAIMVKGQFSCFGSPQHVKTKFGSGYTLLVKVANEEDVESTKKAILSTFANSIVKEEHMLQMNFELKRTDSQTWSTLFDSMERLCVEYKIVDYSLSQTTLEQVFLEFSREVDMSHSSVQRSNHFVEVDLRTRF